MKQSMPLPQLSLLLVRSLILRLGDVQGRTLDCDASM